MTEQQNRPNPDEARQALNSIQQMEQAAIKRLIPPQWFGGIIALLAGSLVTLAVVNLRSYQVFIILLIGLVIAYQSRQTQALPRKNPLKLAVIGAVTLLPLYFVFIIVGQSLASNFGFIGSAILAGLLFAFAVYLFTVLERRWYLLDKGDASQ